tara:strand:+ start:430 stop:600 length:171 start_codon:yes stop_codon:yes gene_type:complete
MSKKVVVPLNHERDAEKMLEQLNDLLSNLQLFNKGVDALKVELQKPTNKMFKINEK